MPRTVRTRGDRRRDTYLRQRRERDYRLLRQELADQPSGHATSR